MKRLIILNNIDNYDFLKLKRNGNKILDMLRANDMDNVFYMPRAIRIEAQDTYNNIAMSELLDIEELKEKYSKERDSDASWIIDNCDNILDEKQAAEIIVGDRVIFTEDSIEFLTLSKNDSERQYQEYDLYKDINSVINIKFRELLTSDTNRKILNKYFNRKLDIEKATICVDSLDYDDSDNILFAIEYFAMTGDIEKLNAVYYENIDQIREIDTTEPTVKIYDLACKIINNYKRNFNYLTLHLKDNMQIQLSMLLNPKFEFDRFLAESKEQLFDTRFNIDIREVALNIIIKQMLDQQINNVDFFRGFIRYRTYSGANQFSSKLLVKKVFDLLLIHAPETLKYQDYGTLHQSFYNSTSNHRQFKEFNNVWIEEIQKKVDLTKINATPKTKLVSSSKRGKKVAICISGMTRNDIKKTLENVLHNVGEPLDADFFIHTWDEREVYPGIGGFGFGNNAMWTEKYFKSINNILPEEIKTRGKFSEVMPNTSNIVLSPKTIKNDSGIFEGVLGNRLKKIKLEDQAIFESGLLDGEYKVRDNYNQAKQYYSMNEAFLLLEEYQREENVEYEYVMRVRIDSMFKSKIDKNILKKVKNNEVLLPITFGAGPDDSVLIARYFTAKRILKLWEKASLYKYLCPYKQFGEHLKIDAHKLLFAHLMYSQIQPIAQTNEDFIPDYLFTVQVPDLTQALSADFARMPNEQIKNYFIHFTDKYCNMLEYNEAYKLITDVRLQDIKYTDDNTQLIIAISGRDLDKIDPNKIHLKMKNLVEEYTYSWSKEYLNRVKVITHTSGQIVINKAFTKDIFIEKKIWRGVVNVSMGNELEFPVGNKLFNQQQQNGNSTYYVSSDINDNFILGITQN